MERIKDIIRALTPTILLQKFRVYKKKKRNKELQNQAKEGGLTQIELENQLKDMGIKPGDSVLVHSALSKIGYINGGPITLINALLNCVGKNGNLLMPTSPNNQLQLNYIQNLEVFNVLETRSKLGKITEVFRTMPNAVRSLHPTEPVSIIGPDAQWFTAEHHKAETPYNKLSPWYKLTEKKGKILYIGCTLANAGTSLHCLEDAVEEFKFPVYHSTLFRVKVKDKVEKEYTIQTKVHNPVFSKKRKCDDLIPMFIEKNVAKEEILGQAKTLVFDAEKMLHVMLEKYKESGVTMYTPKGS